MVTKPEMITTYAAIRTLEGIALRSSEISTLEQIRISVTDRPMPMPLNSVVVMAMVEHMPSNWASTGFLVSRPSCNCFLKFIVTLLARLRRIPARH